MIIFFNIKVNKIDYKIGFMSFMESNLCSKINKIKFSKELPLLILDADEVLLYFAIPFSKFLKRNGWKLKLSDYRLDNAIFKKKSNLLASNKEYKELINKFIEEETHKQPEAEHASEELKKIHKIAQIVILSNVPKNYENERIINLKEKKLDYPLICNEGEKGSALKILSKKTDQKIIFVDDNPHQIKSAAESAPKIIRIHFTICNLVKKVMPKSEFSDYEPKNWKELSSIIMKIFNNAI